MGLSLSSASSNLNANRRPSDISLKSDATDMEVSVLEATTDDIQTIADDDDSHSPADAVASLLSSSKSKESTSPQSKSAYPSVSITPVTSLHTASHSPAYPNINFERRPGIEIIPFSKDPSSSIPSSLTITPVGGKPAKDKSKYKEFRLKESGATDSEAKERDREKERERKERKRRREEEKSPSSGGKPTKMMSLNATLMGPPGALVKMDSSPKLNHKSSSNGSNSGSTPPTTTSSPLTSPSKSSSKGSTPSSSPKHPSSGGKPSMSALSMSALKCKRPHIPIPVYGINPIFFPFSSSFFLDRIHVSIFKIEEEQRQRSRPR